MSSQWRICLVATTHIDFRLLNGGLRYSRGVRVHLSVPHSAKLMLRESECTCSDCNMTYHCDCQLEAKIVEHHDNYRRRYACCPKQDEYACGYFEEVDLQYHNRAMEVIDDLVADIREARDIEEEDRAVEDGMRVELHELKGVVGVAFAAIVVLVAALLVMWSL
ncbi:hypothetical protein Cgig2_001788 [Carnegiea gigantea]|uniref:Uncharacterized protein n=1 Tax=Carnegiea gigantea TaxID=171969 RepID=A0A9Q1QJR2_9CARY|nr:hypothetical protein Cgig2_001788 [Carnegiea gigantea]